MGSNKNKGYEYDADRLYSSQKDKEKQLKLKRKADMDEKPMKAINIVDKETTKIKVPDVEIKIDV